MQQNAKKCYCYHCAKEIDEEQLRFNGPDCWHLDCWNKVQTIKKF